MSKSDYRSYLGWKISPTDYDQCIATRTLPEGGEVECRCVRHHFVAYEGIWPGSLPSSPRLVMTGMCVYSDCWRGQLAPHTPGESPPRPFAIGLALDRLRLLDYLARGRPLLNIEIPRAPCDYQHRLLTWQRECLAEWPSVEEVRYHLPLGIYHRFICEIEDALGHSLPDMHGHLDSYGVDLQGRILTALEPLGVKVSFVDPVEDSGGRPLDPAEADLQPYLDVWGRDDVIGLEDLGQLTIPASIAKQQGGHMAVRVGILGFPHPFSHCRGRFCEPIEFVPQSEQVQRFVGGIQ